MLSKNFQINHSVYNYIHEMGYDPKSTTTVPTPLAPNLVSSQEDCPAEVDVDLRAIVWAAHGKLILAHAASVLGNGGTGEKKEEDDARKSRVAKFNEMQ